MMNTNIAKISDSKKIATFGSDKNLQGKIIQIDDNDSLAFWIQNYFDKMILRGKSKTKKAKKMDLQKFLSFFINEISSYWVKKSETPRGACTYKKFNFFQKELKAPFAFQVYNSNEYIDKDCFQYTEPIIAPAKTFLSQLV